MSKNTKSRNPMIFANREGLAQQIGEWVGAQFAGKPYCVICVSENAEPGNFGFGFPPERGKLSFTRALVVFEGLPINLENVGRWRGWAMEKGAWDLQMNFLQIEATKESFCELVRKSCHAWAATFPDRETVSISKGQFVRMPSEPTAKDDPSLLTMMFGSMGNLMTQVDLVARRFRQACPLDRQKKEVSAYLDKIDKSLASGKPTPGEKVPQLGVENLSDHLPKLLLRGATGVGKTLIARYLHRNCGFEGRPLRVPIPEYLGKEDMFEYDLFGYARGAYTGGTEAGSHGLLLQNAGGVVFFDEIGEANEILQAKLLAFLDDYRVRPRKWEGTPFYCPVLVVAATNQDLAEKAMNGSFRRDLLARFTDRHEIPLLKERVDDLPFILDCLLQRESLNPGGIVREIGQDAFELVKNHGFEEGNFRQLEDLFRAACQRAIRDGRAYLAADDFVQKGARL